MGRSLFARLADQFEDRERRVTRRDALKAGVAAAIAASGLTGCAQLSGRTESRPRVVVVGAGFAGLMAADSLSRAGIDVLVLEARERVGGRVVSFRDDPKVLSGAVVEGGGEFVGLNHPRWIALARRFGLTLKEVGEGEGEASVMLGQERLVGDAGKPLFDAMSSVFAGLTTLASEVDPFAPWNAPRAAALDRMTVAEWLAAFPTSPEARQAVRAQLEHDDAVPLERMSLLAAAALVAGHGGEAYWNDTETHRCREGNQALAEALFESLGSERVRLGTPLRGVEMKNDEGVALHLMNGERIEAEAVVLAVPPPLLKRLECDAQTAALLGRLALPLGPVTKVISRVGGRPWEARGLAADVFSDGLFGYVWEPSRARADASVVIGFSGSDQAARLIEASADDARALAFSEFERLLPDFAQSTPDGATGLRMQLWPLDPFTRGGYSFPAPGMVTERVAAIAALPGPIVLAGEHTSPCFFGYMEGALHGGELAAQRVARYLAQRA